MPGTEHPSHLSSWDPNFWNGVNRPVLTDQQCQPKEALQSLPCRKRKDQPPSVSLAQGH